MSRYGAYDPTENGNTSAMFVYKEVPVTSEKLNRWNGNLEAGFTLLHRVCSRMIAQGEACVLTAGDASALRVVAQDEPEMSVQVLPGWAVVADGLAGLATSQRVPLAGAMAAPLNQPRIDRVVLLGCGALEVVTGTEAVSPVAPELPEEALVLADIVQRVGSTSIRAQDEGVDSYLVDRRPVLVMGRVHRHAEDRRPVETPDGTRTSFTTRDPFVSGTLDVYLNGVLLEESVDYVLDGDGVTYRFSRAPLSHHRIQHRYQPQYIHETE